MLLLILGMVLVIGAIGIAYAAMTPESDRGVNKSLAVLEAMTAAPAELTKELDRPFSERVVEPVQAKMLSIGKRLTGSDTDARLRRKLDFAGNPNDWSVERVTSLKVLAALVGGPAGLLLALVFGVSAPLLLLMALGGLVLGFFAPNAYLYQAAYDRSEKIARALPDAIDLLTISVEAGLGFDAACQQVARNTDGPLADEFARMLAEMQIGRSRREALKSLAERTTVEEVHSFVGAMVQADSFGVPISQVLRVQSGEIRVKRRQRAETKAQQVPVKITVPLIFCVLPTLFIVILGPAVLQFLDNF
ncbi:type II secretion system F family protein [Nocardioides litoris]|uniref:type II secretion system F family protein n=1 Tax=Nocardioides litoris TaxID=1926648 RepID=UPI00111E0315|nr:type II secretion system F family protein [Nocardioides litoris]